MVFNDEFCKNKKKKKKSKLNVYRFQKSKTSITIISSDLIDDRHLILKKNPVVVLHCIEEFGKKNGEKRKINQTSI